MTRGAEVLDMVLASVKIRPSAEASGMVLDKRWLAGRKSMSKSVVY